MKAKILVIVFVVMTIATISIVPAINTLFWLKDEKLNGKWFSLDNLEGMRNFVALEMFGKSLNEREVIVGKNGFLFLGNQHAKILEKTRGNYRPERQEIESWLDKFKNLQNWFDREKIKFVVVVAPNKHTIYPENLPENIRYAEGNTITDDIVKLALKKGVNVLNLKNDLRNAKKKSQLYFLTDTHWNFFGASIAFEKTIEFINFTYESQYELPVYSIVNAKRKGGDLARFLKIKRLLSDTHESKYKLEFETEYQVCHGSIDKLHQLQKCTQRINPRMSVSKIDQYMINETSGNKDKLLLLADSFATASSRLYNATFNTVWKFHHARISGPALADFVRSNKPDIVIYQIVERDLYDQGFVGVPRPASQISE